VEQIRSIIFVRSLDIFSTRVTFFFLSLEEKKKTITDCNGCYINIHMPGSKKISTQNDEVPSVMVFKKMQYLYGDDLKKFSANTSRISGKPINE